MLPLSELNLTILRALSRPPSSVTTAMNGKQAIDVLTSPDQDVDLILTDIMMPEVDGMELMKIVQSSDKPFKSIPIIVMSTVDSDEFKTKCGEAGAQDYLVKPLRKSQVTDLGKHTAGSGGSGSGIAALTSMSSEAVAAKTAGSADGANASHTSTDTEQGARGSSPEDAAAAPVEELGRGKRSSRIADKKAARAAAEAEAAAAEEAAKAARANARAQDKGKENPLPVSRGRAERANRGRAGRRSAGRRARAPGAAPAAPGPAPARSPTSKASPCSSSRRTAAPPRCWSSLCRRRRRRPKRLGCDDRRLARRFRVSSTWRTRRRRRW